MLLVNRLRSTATLSLAIIRDKLAYVDQQLYDTVVQRDAEKERAKQAEKQVALVIEQTEKLAEQVKELAEHAEQQTYILEEYAKHGFNFYEQGSVDELQGTEERTSVEEAEQ
eukprot:Tbor_TRINITY_DN5863_c0_g1::TRINITY_DN5863_c0_g1_i4::g.7057::m.7057